MIVNSTDENITIHCSAKKMLVCINVHLFTAGVDHVFPLYVLFRCAERIGAELHLDVDFTRSRRIRNRWSSTVVSKTQKCHQVVQSHFS